MGKRHASSGHRRVRRRATPAAAARRGATEDWLASQHRRVLWILVGVALAIRVTCFAQLDATPLRQLHQWRQSDMHYYDTWARQIAGGDWLSVRVRLPMHSWHQTVAAQYFAAHPDDRVRLTDQAAARGGGISPEELLWDRWLGVPAFYQDPLYAYLIALTYRVAEPDPRYVLAWQMALGVLTVVLVWRLARRYFGHTVAVCAGALALLNGPLVFYEMLLLRDSLLVCAGLMLIWLTDRAWRGSGPARFGVLGFAMGVSLLLKSTFALLVFGVLVATAVRFRDQRRTLFGRGGAMLAGLLIPLTLLAARNVAVNVPPLSLASSGVLTFVASNEIHYLPDVGFGIDAPVLAAVLGDANGRWRPAVAATLRTQSVGTDIQMIWQKWDRAWHWYEIPNNANFYYMRTQVAMLAWLPVTFWACAPLALAGLVLAARRIRDVWPLYLLVASALVPLLLFYVLARFRIELAAALLPFAAHPRRDDAGSGGVAGRTRDCADGVRGSARHVDGTPAVEPPGAHPDGGLDSPVFGVLPAQGLGCGRGRRLATGRTVVPGLLQVRTGRRPDRRIGRSCSGFRVGGHAYGVRTHPQHGRGVGARTGAGRSGTADPGADRSAVKSAGVH
jgi:hypothetical protein